MPKVIIEMTSCTAISICQYANEAPVSLIKMQRTVNFTEVIICQTAQTQPMRITVTVSDKNNQDLSVYEFIKSFTLIYLGGSHP